MHVHGGSSAGALASQHTGGGKKKVREKMASVMASALCFMLYGCSLHPHVTPRARGHDVCPCLFYK